MTLTPAQLAALARSMAPDSPEKRRRAAGYARRVAVAAAVEAAEHARRAELVRLSDEYEAQRPGPFRPDGPPPVGRRRPVVLAVGDDDHAPPYELPPEPGILAVGDDL